MKRGVSIGELMELPNRVSHTLYYHNYKNQLADWELQRTNPQAAKDKASAEAMSEAFQM